MLLVSVSVLLLLFVKLSSFFLRNPAVSARQTVKSILSKRIYPLAPITAELLPRRLGRRRTGAVLGVIPWEWYPKNDGACWTSVWNYSYVTDCVLNHENFFSSIMWTLYGNCMVFLPKTTEVTRHTGYVTERIGLCWWKPCGNNAISGKILEIHGESSFFKKKTVHYLPTIAQRLHNTWAQLLEVQCLLCS